MTDNHRAATIRFDPQRLKPALEYIDGYWKKLEKFRPHDDGTLVGLPNPYFVPSIENTSGFSFEEMFYWDSFFIAQGLIGTPREHLVQGLVENMAAMMDRFNIIPNSGRTFFTGRSQPPFFTTLIMQVYRANKNKRWLSNLMTVAKNEYRTVWMGTAQPNWRQVFHGLSRYYDVNVLDDLAECESGWDYNTRFEHKALSYIPVDLNALLYKYEKDFEESARILGDDEEAYEWSKRAIARRQTMQKYLWDDENRCYFDFNFMNNKKSPVFSLAAFYPMWVGMDDKRTAEGVMANLDRFECAGGLATAAKEPVVHSYIPTQWAYPNGWAPLQLIAVEAMERYGYHYDADRIARKWIQANLHKFETTGDFFEKYNVVDIDAEPVQGVYPSQTGFGWTNAVFMRFCATYLTQEELPELDLIPERETLGQLVRNPRRTLRRVGWRLNSFTPRRSN